MPPRKSKSISPTPITSHTHADTRPNTPTEVRHDR